MGKRYYYDEWQPYVPVGERRRKAAKKIAKMRKAGHKVAPVEIQGRKIAATFWGDAWCKNLEDYSDFANRLPRGRTYVRNGSVIDLQIEEGRVHALVSGSHIYEIEIRIKPLTQKRWTAIKNRCAGRIDSLVELLQGAVSKSVMEIVTRKGEGLFPEPSEIRFNCSCPDWASMCKHVAATLYGVGARLDHEPDLLFRLRGVDPTEMVEEAAAKPAAGKKPQKGRLLETESLSSLFGVDIDTKGNPGDEAPPPRQSARRSKRVADNAAKKAPPRSSRKAGRLHTKGEGGTSKSAVQKKLPPKARARKASASKTAAAGTGKRTVLTKEALARLHARTVAFVEKSPFLHQRVSNVQLARGRLYIWHAPANLMVRITPVGPRAVSMETPRKNAWAEHKQGLLATVLKHLETDPEGLIHASGPMKKPKARKK